MGLYMCKSHERELLELLKIEDIVRLNKAQKTKLRYEKQFQRYCKKPGVEMSCHIPREHGPDVSLMTEIVYSQVTSSLFPKPAN